MARALWKGAISFGLVNIPVELYPAEDRKSFKFSMLDKRDLSPVGYKRYSKKIGQGSRRGPNIVKGYEYEKDQYVVLSDEDFRRPTSRRRRRSTSGRSCGADEIPLEYFETPYYLAPGARGQKVYALLRETLQGDRARRRRASRDAHDAAPCRGRPEWTRADAQYAALPGRAARRRAASSCRRRASRAAGVSAEGSRARQAPGRRHDRALGPGQYQEHVPRRSHGADQGKDQAGADQGDHRACQGRGSSRARRRSSTLPTC